MVFETYLLPVGHNTKDKQDLCMFWICLWNKPSSFWRLTIDQQSLALLLDCMGGMCQDSLPPAHLPYHLKPLLNWANRVFYKVSYLSCICGMGIFWSLLPFHPAQSHSLPSRSQVPVSPCRRMWSCARHCRFPPPFTTVQPSSSAPACNPKWPVWNEAELVRLRWDWCREGLRGISGRADLLMRGLSLLHCSWQPWQLPGSEPESTSGCPTAAQMGCGHSPRWDTPDSIPLGPPHIVPGKS